MLINSLKKLYRFIIPERLRIEIIHFLTKFKGYFLRGNKYYCNYCHKGFRKFLSKGNTPRPNAICPNCMSLERTRLLLEYLKNETVLFDLKLKVLHFAPERSLFNLLRKEDIIYIDGDINPLMAHNIIDITDIPYPDNYFDLIICSHVLGHVPDETKALKELNRVLNLKGELIIMSLVDYSMEKTFESELVKSAADKLKYYGETDLERLYGKDILERLRRGGFYVNEIDYRNKLEDRLREKLSLGDGSREMIYKCTKIKS